MSSLPSKNPTPSFWHSQPSIFLLGHRTTPSLPPTADIVIIGSGITGASVARYLFEDERGRAERLELSVLMLEAREVGWGATGRNGGHCQPLLFDSAPNIAAFELRNYHTLQSHIQTHNIPCEWRTLPGCRTFWTPALAKAVEDDVRKLKRDAPELGKVVSVVDDREELRKLRVSDGAEAATLTETAASLWPYKYVAWVLEGLVRDRKVNLQTGTPVLGIEACGDGEGSVVRTERGSVRARHVVLATNAYTSYLLPEFEELIVPERGTMTALIPPKRSERLEHSYGFVGAMGGNPIHDDYLVQRPFEGVENAKGHLMFGGGHVARKLRMVGESDDSVVDEGCTRYLRESLLKLLTPSGQVEGVEELEATHQWSGIWGTSKDHVPWVGEVPGRSGVWVAGGYSGHGMPNATLCGKAIVDMLLAQYEGVKSRSIQEQLVEGGHLPKAYLISEERLKRCRKLDSVEVQDRNENVGMQKVTKPKPTASCAKL